MGLLDWIRKTFNPGSDRNSYWVYVRCSQCQEVLRARVDLAHDVSVRYDSQGKVMGYFTRKTLIGANQCFNQVDVMIEFDSRRQPSAHEVSGGELIDREEYEREAQA